MKRPTRDPEAALFSRSSLLIALFRPNRSLSVVVVVAAALGGTLLWPLARPLHLDDLAVTLAAGVRCIGLP